MASKARKISDKELVRALFPKPIRKALKIMVATTRAEARAKGRKNRKKKKR